MGLTEAEFWRLTPAKFFALVEARNRQVMRRDFRSGLIASVICQALGGKQEPFDFFPQHKKPKKPPSAAARKAAWRAYVATEGKK
ncbi:hypothetical protein CCP3SC15_610014 [Gammaproteobacteria bacterium]